MNATTGPTVATVSCWAIAPCPKWAKVNQSMLSTTSAKTTKTVKSVSVRSMVMLVLASLSATLGNGTERKRTSSLRTMTIPVKRSSSCATSNSSNNHIANVVYSPRTITPSGPQPVSITKKTVHQLVVIQSSMNAAVELTNHSNGSDSTTGNVAQTELS